MTDEKLQSQLDVLGWWGKDIESDLERHTVETGLFNKAVLEAGFVVSGTKVCLASSVMSGYITSELEVIRLEGGWFLVDNTAIRVPFGTSIYADMDLVFLVDVQT